MTDHPSPLFFLLTERCGGGVIFGEPRVYSIPEGGNVTIRCSLAASDKNKKFLCREECKKVLFETTDVIAKSDRYSIEYGSKIFFNVTITQLTKSDSGWYRCGVVRTTEQNTCQEFKISITNRSEGLYQCCIHILITYYYYWLLTQIWTGCMLNRLLCFWHLCMIKYVDMPTLVFWATVANKSQDGFIKSSDPVLSSLIPSQSIRTEYVVCFVK